MWTKKYIENQTALVSCKNTLFVSWSLHRHTYVHLYTYVVLICSYVLPCWSIKFTYTPWSTCAANVINGVIKVVWTTVSVRFWLQSLRRCSSLRHNCNKSLLQRSCGSYNEPFYATSCVSATLSKLLSALKIYNFSGNSSVWYS